jgi:hypothetical protein
MSCGEPLNCGTCEYRINQIPRQSFVELPVTANNSQSDAIFLLEKVLHLAKWGGVHSWVNKNKDKFNAVIAKLRT